MISGSGFYKTDNTSYLNLYGGLSGGVSAMISLCGGEFTDEPGWFTIFARESAQKTSKLTGKPNGTLTWYNGTTTKNLAMQEDFIPRSGGAVMTGSVIARTVNTSELALCSGSAWNDGASIILRGKNHPNAQGFISICAFASDGTNCGIELNPWGYFQPSTDNAVNCGASARRWATVYSATSAINTSDSRLKNTITDIDDSLLDAWETIQPKQYKFNDATETKGEQARFHTGYLAQDIEKACTDNNIDATRYGLFCYDSWEEEPEITEDVEVEKDGIKTTEKRIVRPKREKGDAYSLRYEEALVVECAYLRREINKLKEELKQLKAK